jgi:hypothetical protein
MSAAAEVIAALGRREMMLATAESCTGGMIAAAITDVPGSSAALDRGFVTYSNAAKVEMLGVAEATLRDHGAVSEQVAAEMAVGALRAVGGADRDFGHRHRRARRVGAQARGPGLFRRCDGGPDLYRDGRFRPARPGCGAQGGGGPCAGPVARHAGLKSGPGARAGQAVAASGP